MLANYVFTEPTQNGDTNENLDQITKMKTVRTEIVVILTQIPRNEL